MRQVTFTKLAYGYADEAMSAPLGALAARGTVQPAVRSVASALPMPSTQVAANTGMGTPSITAALGRKQRSAMPAMDLSGMNALAQRAQQLPATQPAAQQAVRVPAGLPRPRASARPAIPAPSVPAQPTAAPVSYDAGVTEITAKRPRTLDMGTTEVVGTRPGGPSGFSRVMQQATAPAVGVANAVTNLPNSLRNAGSAVANAANTAGGAISSAAGRIPRSYQVDSTGSVRDLNVGFGLGAGHPLANMTTGRAPIPAAPGGRRPLVDNMGTINRVNTGFGLGNSHPLSNMVTGRSYPASAVSARQMMANNPIVDNTGSINRLDTGFLLGASNPVANLVTGKAPATSRPALPAPTAVAIR